MAIKKPLEFENAPPEESAEGAEARYESFARRLELTTKGGDAHRDFSHESGTVQVDRAGIDEFRAREQAELLARAEKTKRAVAIEEARLQKAMTPPPEEQEWTLRMSTLRAVGRVLLALVGIYFLLSGLSSFYLVVTGQAGRIAASIGTTLGLLAVAAFVLALAFLPMRVARIVGRIAYGSALIYFGITGTWALIRLWYNPPAAGVRWGAGLLMLASLIFLIWSFRQLLALRARLHGSFGEPDEELLRDYPLLANDRHLRIALYTVEGLILSCVYVALAIIMFRTNLLELLFGCLTSPALAFYLLYPFFAYMFFRKVFYGTTR